MNLYNNIGRNPRVLEKIPEDISKEFPVEIRKTQRMVEFIEKFIAFYYYYYFLLKKKPSIQLLRNSLKVFLKQSVNESLRNSCRNI